MYSSAYTSSYIIKNSLVLFITIYLFSNSNLLAQTYQILPLGNSITQADNSEYSYRYYLWKKLFDDGVNFNFIGSLTNNYGGNPVWPPYLGQSFDQDHDGHSGWRADQLLNGNSDEPGAGSLPIWLTTYTPDIALVHIGTNDLLKNDHITVLIDDLKNIIGELRSDNPNVKILLAQVIPSTDPKIDYRIPSYNNEITNLVFSEYDPLSPIFIVDQYSGINTATDLYDDYHPNALGEDKIAEQFRLTINKAINGQNPGLWVGTTSSDWATASNWAENEAPSSYDYVFIPETATNWPVFSGNLTIGITCKGIKMLGPSSLRVNGDLTISEGSQFVCTDDANIYVQGNWVNNGFFDEGNSTLNFVGTINSSITVPGSISGGGKINTSATGNIWNIDKFNLLDCYEDFILVSAKVYANGAGNRTFYWSTYGGPIEEQVTVMVPDGESRVTLNFHITPGTNHKLGVLGNPQLWRDKPGAAYPYPIGQVASFQSSAGGFDAYFFLYDIEYSLPNENFNNLNISNMNSVLSIDCESSLFVNGNILMEPNSKLTIGSGDTIITNGNLTLNGDVSGTASLVDKGNLAVAGSTTVQNYYTGNPDNNLSRWHFIGSPVSDAVSNIFLNLYMKYWDEPTYTWNYVTATNYSLVPGTAYEIWSTLGDVTVNYSGGILNSGDISPNLTATDVNNDGFGAGDGWNFVSNPYASAIDLGTENNPLAGYTFTNLDNSFYFWNGTNYSIFNRAGNGSSTNGGTQYVPAMQGFFIKANALNPVLTIPNAARLHSGQSNYKSSGDSDLIKLQIKGNGFSDELLVLSNPEATPGFDSRFDAYKLSGIEEAPGIFSILDNINLSINTLPEINENTKIKLGCTIGRSNIYTLRLTDFSGFIESHEIYLEDLSLNSFTNLKENPVYHFYAVPSDNTNRFVLYFSRLENLPKINNNELVVYAHDNSIFVKINRKGDAEITIYELTGQQLASKRVKGDGLYSAPIQSGTGIYIVNVISKMNSISKKVFVK